MHLHALGRAAADCFAEHYSDKIGVRSSTDIVTKFLSRWEVGGRRQ